MRQAKIYFVFALLVFIVSIFTTSFAAAAEEKATMYVDGRYLHDPCGEKVVLRGYNAMIIYWDQLGETTYPEIAKTGANACRIFWTAKANVPAKRLDRTLQNCRDNHMIPIICVWDATGKWEKIDACIDYWQQPEVVKVLQKHEKYLLLNIANEAGNKEVSHEAYRKKYKGAIASLREAGLRMPLVIDAAHWGRDESYILDNAEYFLNQDPRKNLIFSWHPWDTKQPQSRYKKAIDASIDKNICMIIGEFSRVGVFYKKPIDYDYLITYCQKKDIGWLVWVWQCGKEPDGHSVTKDKIYGHWANGTWGKDITIDHPHSIKNTAKRTPFMQKGTCVKMD